MSRVRLSGLLWWDAEERCRGTGIETREAHGRETKSLF